MGFTSNGIEVRTETEQVTVTRTPESQKQVHRDLIVAAKEYLSTNPIPDEGIGSLTKERAEAARTLAGDLQYQFE